MARTKKESDLSLSGQSLASRFALTMTIALAAVMLAAGAFLYSRMVGAAENVQEKTFVEATRLQGPLLQQQREDMEAEIKLKVYGEKPDPNRKRIENPMAAPNATAESFAGGEVKRVDAIWGEGKQTRGHNYVYRSGGHDVMPPLLVPATAKINAGEGRLPIILGVKQFVILAGALVAYWVGNAVSRPLELIVGDIAQISRGDLRHRTRVRVGGEIMLLATTIDRMAGNLEQAQAVSTMSGPPTA
jgi:methyl-accepting chemotaxis protein